MTRNPPEDDDLAARLMRGEKGALDVLNSRYGPALVGALMKHRRWLDIDDVENIYHETMAREVPKAIQKYDGTRKSLKSWLFMLAHANLLDALRRGSAARRDVTVTDAFWNHQRARGDGAGGGGNDPPDHAIDRADPRLAALKVIWAELSEKQRKIMLLDAEFYDGLDDKTIADWLEMTRGAVRTERCRAKEKIKAALKRLQRLN